MSNKQSEFEHLLVIVREAHEIAVKHQHELVTTEHCLRALLNANTIKKIVKDMGLDYGKIVDELDVHLQSPSYPSSSNGYAPMETLALDGILRKTVARVMFRQDKTSEQVQQTDFLLTIIEEGDPESPASVVLTNAGMTSLSLKEHLSHGSTKPGQQPNQAQPRFPGEEPRQKDITTKEEAEALLAKYCDNLNEIAAEGGIDPVIGREAEVAALIKISARRTKNNSVIVGEPGVGKTAVVEGLAKMIVEKKVPEIMLDSVVYSLNVGNLIAGTKYRGELEDRLRHVLKSLTFIESPILFIDEIHMIMGAGAGGNGSTMDVANLLKPALSKGKLRCIGSTTFDEFQKHFEKDRALLRRFQRMDVKEPSPENAKLILRGLKEHYEKFHGVTYTDEAIDLAVDLTHRYVQNRFLPDKAIDVIDEAGATQRVRAPDEKVQVITPELIQVEVSRIAKIPEQTVKTNEKQKLRGLESDLKSVVFGQDQAVDTLVNAVMVGRAGLRDEGKPAGAFLFVGPTGVGKTEMVKQLAKTLGVEMIRFDMSEYMEKHTVSKLIGSPPGYVGHGDGGAGSGLLVSEVENKPHSVLLLDEMEKAHPDVFNIFLQVLDDGRLTNSSGKTVRFDNVTIIMTSNAGARASQGRAIGFNGTEKIGEIDKAVKTTFAPEFLNRLDAVVQFTALKPENMMQVVDKFLGALSKQLEAQNRSMTVSMPAKEWLAANGYNKLMGARPLARLIQEKIKQPMSKVILFDEQADRVLKVDLVDDNIVVS